MRTDDFVQHRYPGEPVTIEREIRVFRMRIEADRMMLAHYLFHQPPGRHFRGERECPYVVRYADRIEQWECRLRTLERWKKLADETRRAA